MSTTYGDRPLRVTFTSNDSSGVAEFFDGSETGAIGITVPRFSTDERNALNSSSVKQGMIIFNETDGKMQVYTGSDSSNTASSWTDIGGGTILADTDGNTNIEIGATTADEIDVDIAGTKVATVDAVGINIEAGAIVAVIVPACLTPTAPASTFIPAPSNVAILVPAISTSISSAVVAPISIFVFPSVSATIAAGENIGLFGDVTFTGTVTVAGEMVVV